MVADGTLLRPAPLPLITPLITVNGTLTVMALPFAVNELDTVTVFNPVSETMSELAPLAALPKAARAPAGVEAPVPPLPTASVPLTSEANATAPGVQALPLYRKSWLAAGAPA